MQVFAPCSICPFSGTIVSDMAVQMPDFLPNQFTYIVGLLPNVVKKVYISFSHQGKMNVILKQHYNLRRPSNEPDTAFHFQ